MQESRLISLALVAPALLILLALFVYPLGFSLVTAFEGEAGAWTVGNFTKAFDFYWRDMLFTVLIIGLSTGADRHRRDRDRRFFDARRKPARGRAAALALSLALVHPVRGRGPADAHLPRQERHDEQHAGRARPVHAARCPELSRLARHRRDLRLEADALRGPPGRGRHGGARPRDDRGRAQPRRRPAARAARDRAAAGPPDAAWSA